MLVIPVKIIPGTTVGEAMQEAMGFCNKNGVAIDLIMGGIVERIVPGPITLDRKSKYVDSYSAQLVKSLGLNGQSKGN